MVGDPWCRPGLGCPGAGTSHIAVAVAHQYDHGCVVRSAGSVVMNVLLDCVAGPEAIWLEVRP